MNKGDEIVDRGADRLQGLADRTAGNGGVKEKIAQELADDAAFLRKLKPSLMVRRAKGEAPTNQPPGGGTVSPAGPQLGGRPKPKRGGPNPFVIAAGAFVAGIVLAKAIDWWSHAHPRD